MDAKVKEFLEKKQAEESAVLLEKKHDLLRRLGLVERVEVGKDDDYVSYSLDNEKNVYIYYKYVYPEITDEEYKKLLKYDTAGEIEPEGNGENGLSTIATIYLILCAVAFVICLSVTMDKGDPMLLVCGVFAVVIGLVQYWVVKVFTNISRKATAIYKLLKDKEK